MLRRPVQEPRAKTSAVPSQPISESDLAKYMADCIRDPKLWDKVLPIGGPGPALSAKEQGDILFDVLEKKPFFLQASELCLPESLRQDPSEHDSGPCTWAGPGGSVRRDQRVFGLSGVRIP